MRRPRASASRTGALVRGQGQTALVVEDDAVARQAMGESLELLGYRVLEAADGQQVLAVFEQRGKQADHPGRPVLVLSDIVMPEKGRGEKKRERKGRRNDIMNYAQLKFGSGQDPPGARILVVDDEPEMAIFLSQALENLNLGYRVVIARTGEGALETLKHSTVDLLITDLRMPGISGLELIRRVRASSPRTRIILITAYGSDAIKTEAHRLQVHRYITKPFDFADLKQAVQEALRNGTDKAVGHGKY